MAHLMADGPEPSIESIRAKQTEECPLAHRARRGVQNS
jgi:hypothetical protein